MKLLALCAAGIGLMLCASCTNNKHLISDELNVPLFSRILRHGVIRWPKVTSSRYSNNP